MPASFASDVLAAFVEVERAAASGRLLIAARAAEAGEWKRRGCPSPESWLAGELGTTTGRARADLDTSQRLDDLDATADAVRDGKLSPEQADAVSDAAKVNPDAEADLLEAAQKESLRRMRQEAERRKAEARSEAEKAEREARVRRERSARFWYRNGAGHLEVTGPISDLKELEQRIQHEVDAAFRAKRATPVEGERRDTRANYAFDALMAFGRQTGSASWPSRSEASGSEPATSGPSPAGPSSTRRRPKRSPLTRLTMIRVDLAALVRGDVHRGEVCEIGGVCVSVGELRRMLGDSILELVLTNGEAVIDVVNLGRKPTVAQMVAKLFTDACCSVEGCDRAARLEFDHRDDWVRVMVTELANLDLLCDHHHDQKTRADWQLVEGTGRRPMVPPTDPRHPRFRAPGAGTSPASTADHSSTVGSSSTVDASCAATSDVPVDLVARAEALREREARRHAHVSGQSALFDTG